MAGMFLGQGREHIVVVAPDGANYFVMMRGREDEWQGSALKDAVAGRRATVVGRLESAEGRQYRVWVEPAEVRISGRGMDDLAFLRGFFRDLEQGLRKKRGFEPYVIAALAGVRDARVAAMLRDVAVRDYPFERLDIPYIKETSVGVMAMMGERAIPDLRKVVEAYSTRTGMNNRRVFAYSIVCLGDAGDRKAWQYAESLNMASGVELGCYFKLFERSRDLLPEGKWSAVLKLADKVLRMEEQTTTKRAAQAAMDAYTSGTWGISPRHLGDAGQ